MIFVKFTLTFILVKQIVTRKVEYPKLGARQRGGTVRRPRGAVYTVPTAAQARVFVDSPLC